MFTKFIDHQMTETEHGADLKVTLHAPTRPIASFRQNLETALAHMTYSIGKPLNIRYSGGLDSQALVIAAKDAGLEFKVHHLMYTYQGKCVATTDYEQSEAFAKKAGIKVEYVPMELKRVGPPFLIESPRHIYNDHTLVVGASGDAFHYNCKNFVGRDYNYNDFFYFPMDVLGQLRLWSSYGKDIYTRFYSESAELFFSMLFHKSTEAFSAFVRDNPEKHKKYDLHQMKFVLLYDEYGDQLIYYDKKHASDELPEGITKRHDAFGKRFWGIGNLWFKEAELRQLMRGHVKTIEKTMRVPRDLLWNINLPLSR